jgi:hypothetical protein
MFLKQTGATPYGGGRLSKLWGVAMIKHKLRFISMLLLAFMLTGCSQGSETNHIPAGKPGSTVEATSNYAWMAGESPVPNLRMGYYRAGVNNGSVAVGANGIYAVKMPLMGSDRFIYYADNQSNQILPLCARPDCMHNGSDCNAHLYLGGDITYSGGYLYAMEGEGFPSEFTHLIRMNPDGSGRVVICDLLSFVKKKDGGEIIFCKMMTEGYCIFSSYYWKVVTDTTPELDNSGNPDENHVTKDMTYIKTYMYKLDGSMAEPKPIDCYGGPLYNRGDAFITYVTQNGVKQYWVWNPDTNTSTYLTDYPGAAGWFGTQAGFYGKDGYIWRIDYSTQSAAPVIKNPTEDNYYAFCFPDCIVLACKNSSKSADDNIYIYNWDYELVDTLKITYSHYGMTQHMIAMENAERIFLSNEGQGFPMYYIEKSELGTGNCTIHEFQKV